MNSIRRQMALAVSGVAAIALLVGGLGLYLSLRLALETQFDATLKTKAEALVSASDAADGEFEIDIDVQAFAGFGSSSPGDYFVVAAPDGRVIQRSPSLGSSDLPGIDELPASPEGFADLVLPEEIPGRAHWRTFTPSEDVAGRFSDLRIVVASDLGGLRRTLRLVTLMIAAFGGSGILVLLLVLPLVVGKGLRSLGQLGTEVQRIDVQRLSHRLSIEGFPIELQVVPEKLNELLGRLEASFARERRFSSNAAHELRTPLAELKAMVELGARWREEFTDERVGDMLEAIAELETLIEKLALLASVESGVPHVLKPVDLPKSVAEQLERCRDDLAARDLRVDLRVEAGEFVTDPALWSSIVHNLVGNAATYSPAGGSIEVEASPRHFRVANAAPDLVPADLERLSERFWRKAPSDAGGRHSGLGLSIVRSIVEFLGGRFEARLENGRIQIEIRWN